MKLHGNARDLTGQRFGKLLVLYPTEKKTAKKYCLALCL